MTKCYGCRTCEIACKSEYNLPMGIRWRKVHEIKNDKPMVHAFLPLACNHCSAPECLKQCPVSAYSKRGDGLVLQDHEKCIGCGTCIKVCPYSAPQFDEKDGKTGKASKCSLCVERQDNGLSVRCIDACPAGAIEMGDREELSFIYAGAVNRIGNMPEPKTRPNILIKKDPKL